MCRRIGRDRDHDDARSHRYGDEAHELAHGDSSWWTTGVVRHPAASGWTTGNHIRWWLGLSRPTEDDASVGDGLHLVLRVVGVGVVARAEQASAGDVGLPAPAPGQVVVDVAHRCGPVASF